CVAEHSDTICADIGDCVEPKQGAQHDGCENAPELDEMEFSFGTPFPCGRYKDKTAACQFDWDNEISDRDADRLAASACFSAASTDEDSTKELFHCCCARGE